MANASTNPQAGGISPGLSWLSIDSVEAWNRNPRKNDGAVEGLAKSILRFGFGAPVVVWGSRQELRAGHARLAAVRFLQRFRPVFEEDEDGNPTDRVAGWEERPGDDPFHVPASFDQGGVAILAPEPDAVPVRVMEFRNEAEADAYGLADNKLNELAEWDDKQLAAIFADLDRDGAGIDDLGWSSEDLLDLIVKNSPGEADLIAKLGGPGSGAEPPEEFPEYGDDIDTEHRCPKCGYEWSGKSS